MGVLPLLSATVWRGPRGLIPFGAWSGSLPPSPVCPLCLGVPLCVCARVLPFFSFLACSKKINK